MKVGDKVICVNDNKADQLIKPIKYGHIYTVYRIFPSSVSRKKCCMVHGSDTEWMQSRFRLVRDLTDLERILYGAS